MLFQLPVTLDSRRLARSHPPEGCGFSWCSQGTYRRWVQVKWNGKWEQSAKPAVFWWRNFGPYPFRDPCWAQEPEEVECGLLLLTCRVDWSDKAAISAGTFQGAPGICPNSSHGNLANNRTPAAGFRGEHLQPRQPASAQSSTTTLTCRSPARLVEHWKSQHSQHRAGGSYLYFAPKPTPKQKCTSSVALELFQPR